MILYNITLNVEEGLGDDFLVWIKAVHIPEFLKTGLFLEHKMFKLISNHGDSPGTLTFALQFYLKDVKTFLEYSDNHAGRLSEELKAKFGNGVLAFRTLLENID